LIVHTPQLQTVEYNQTQYFALLSDLHIGAASLDLAALKRDLQRARERNARILINGDVFDAILPSDKKRYNPTALHERIRGRADVLNAAIDWAVEILSPYGDLIDLIGIGNHETAVEKHHGSDPVAILINLLHREGHSQIAYGGYTGWVKYTFKTRSETPTGGQWWPLRIYYHHGSGGGAPVTKGMLTFSRKAMWVEGSDVIWLGHQHHRTVDADVVQRLNKSNRVEHVRRLRVMSGSYLLTYEQQDPSEALANGRRASYASDWGVAPQDKGGVFLAATFAAEGILQIKAEL
jgi:hypothetical protein